MIETGQQLVNGFRAMIRRYLVLSPAQELVLALWYIHTWMYERLTGTTPYLEITGVSGSGKTRVLDLGLLLTRGGEKLQTIRTMYICRRINETGGLCTIMIDEAERLADNSYGDQRAMLAGGYREGGVHGVTVGKGTVRFPVYCPKAFTSLKTMTPVLHNRSIPFWMELGEPEASLTVDAVRAKADAAELVASVARVMGGVQTVTFRYDEEQERVVPEFHGKAPSRTIKRVEADWLTERDREIWTPLVTLAHTLELNATTIHELEMASVDLSALRGVIRTCDVKAEDASARERSAAVRLLHDVKAVIKPGETFIGTADLLARLTNISTAPWRVWQRRGLSDEALAQLMGAHGLQAKRGRPGKGTKAERQQVRGYSVKEIEAIKL